MFSRKKPGGTRAGQRPQQGESGGKELKWGGGGAHRRRRRRQETKTKSESGSQTQSDKARVSIPSCGSCWLTSYRYH